MAHLNQAGIAELLVSPGVVAHLEATAGQVVEEVRRIAPHHTGAYAASVRVGEPRLDPAGAEVPVETTDPFYHLVEYGSVNNEAYAPLRRAVVNLGLDLHELPKP